MGYKPPSKLLPAITQLTHGGATTNWWVVVHNDRWKALEPESCQTNHKGFHPNPSADPMAQFSTFRSAPPGNPWVSPAGHLDLLQICCTQTATSGCDRMAMIPWVSWEMLSLTYKLLRQMAKAPPGTTKSKWLANGVKLKTSGAGWNNCLNKLRNRINKKWQ